MKDFFLQIQPLTGHLVNSKTQINWFHLHMLQYVFTSHVLLNHLEQGEEM